MVRILTLLVLLVSAVVHAFAQCCCTDIIVHVSLKDLPSVRSEREFEVRSLEEYHTTQLADRDSTDLTLRVRMDAGCGLAERRFVITRGPTGERMELSVLFVGYDGVHPSLRVPFTPGLYDIDLEHLIGCADLSGYGDLAPIDSIVPITRTIRCTAGSLRVERDQHGVTLEPLDLRAGAFRPGRLDAPFGFAAAHGYAEFPGGTAALVAELVEHEASGHSFGRPWTTYTGIGCVNENGRFHARIDRERTPRVHALEMALMDVVGWLPARISDDHQNGTSRPIRSMVRFSFSKSDD